MTLTPNIERYVMHGVDWSDAGTVQEKYFIILAGLLQKNLEAQIETQNLLSAVRDQLADLNINVARTQDKTPAPVINRPVAVPSVPKSELDSRKKR
jgi:hypothetical protein